MEEVAMGPGKGHVSVQTTSAMLMGNAEPEVDSDYAL